MGAVTSLSRVGYRTLRFPLFAFFLLSSICVAAKDAQAPSSTNILVLFYGERDSLGYNRYLNGLRAQLETGTKSPVYIYEETFDQGWKSDDPHHLQSMRRLLIDKYKDRNIQVIVPIGNYPLRFLEANKQSFAPQAKVVYFALGGAPTTSLRATGVVMHFDLGPTIDVALQQNPGTRHFLIVTGASPIDREYLKFFDQSIQRKAAELKGRVEFEYVGQHETFAQLRQRLGTGTNDSISLFLTYYVDTAGQKFNSLQALRVANPVASRPMYCWTTLGLGLGVVGGKLAVFEDAGATTGKLVERVIKGEDPASIAPLEDSFQSYIFDGGQMKRWGFPYDHLPAGSQIINRNDTLWELYAGRIILLIVVVCLQGFLIIFFLRDHLGRRLAERALVDGDQLKASVLESMGTRVVVLDAQGNIIAANHYWDEYLAVHGLELEKISNISKYFEL